jgi:hypothetical protein
MPPGFCFNAHCWAAERQRHRPEPGAEHQIAHRRLLGRAGQAVGGLRERGRAGRRADKADQPVGLGLGSG